jgi:hypothetical protein
MNTPLWQEHVTVSQTDVYESIEATIFVCHRVIEIVDGKPQRVQCCRYSALNAANAVDDACNLLFPNQA